MKGLNSLYRIYNIKTFGNVKLCRGFSLLEALLAVMILSMSAVAMTALYMGGMKSIETQERFSQVDHACRTRMELLISLKLDQLSSGSASVLIQDENQTITWTVTPIDLDSDTVVETDASQVTVTLDGRSLETILIDTAGKVSAL